MNFVNPSEISRIKLNIVNNGAHTNGSTRIKKSIALTKTTFKLDVQAHSNLAIMNDNFASRGMVITGQQKCPWFSNKSHVHILRDN